MASAFQVIIPHRILRVLSVPPRPNHLDRYLLVFLLREAIDPSAERLSMASPLRLLVLLCPIHSLLAHIGFYRGRHLVTSTLAATFAPWLPGIPPQSTLVAQQGSDML